MGSIYVGRLTRRPTFSHPIDALSLKPWQSPPIHIEEDANEPDNAEREPDTAARKLLRRMLAAGVSRYDPDPLKAPAGAKRRSSH